MVEAVGPIRESGLGRQEHPVSARSARKDIDGHCRPRVGREINGPEDQFYGDRTYRARPGGHIWTFGQTVKRVTPTSGIARAGSTNVRVSAASLDRILTALAVPIGAAPSSPPGTAPAGELAGRLASSPAMANLGAEETASSKKAHPVFDARVESTR
jgi:hypothetical protein